nr:hypothetical protein [Desulfacinum infernum]
MRSGPCPVFSRFFFPRSAAGIHRRPPIRKILSGNDRLSHLRGPFRRLDHDLVGGELNGFKGHFHSGLGQGLEYLFPQFIALGHMSAFIVDPRLELQTDVVVVQLRHHHARRGILQVIRVVFHQGDQDPLHTVQVFRDRDGDRNIQPQVREVGVGDDSLVHDFGVGYGEHLAVVGDDPCRPEADSLHPSVAAVDFHEVVDGEGAIQENEDAGNDV